MRSRRARRRHDKKIGNRLFVVAILASCVTVVVAVMLFVKHYPGGANLQNARQWLGLTSLRSVDAGPDPIIHNPAEIVEHFVNAKSRSDLEALCRRDDNSRQILDTHAKEVLAWLKGHRKWVPLHEAKANGLLFSVFAVTHIDKPPRPVYVVQTRDGAKIDIAAFLGWCSTPWENLATGKATGAKIVRASASRIDYYNYRFKDDKIYQSYELISFGDRPALYGYVLRGTPAAVALEKLVTQNHSFPVVVSLDGCEPDSPHRQFRITHVLAAGWVMGPEIIEEHLPQLVDDPALLMKIPGKDSGLPSSGKNPKN